VIRPRLTVELNLDTLGQLPNDGSRAALIAMFRRQQEATGVDRQWHREKLRRQYIRAHWREIPWIAAPSPPRSSTAKKQRPTGTPTWPPKLTKPEKKHKQPWRSHDRAP